MSESFKAVIEDIANRAENAHDLAMDNPDSTTHCDAISAMLTDFIRRLVSAHDAEIKDLRSACEADGENCRIAIQSAQARFDELLVSKNAEIDTLNDQVAQLAEMQNADIQCAKMIKLEKSLGAQKAINHNLVDQNAELVADLKRLNAQYQHLVNVKSCEWDDNRKPDLITHAERLFDALETERMASDAAKGAYVRRKLVEDGIRDLVRAIRETRSQKEAKHEAS